MPALLSEWVTKIRLSSVSSTTRTTPLAANSIDVVIMESIASLGIIPGKTRSIIFSTQGAAHRRRWDRHDMVGSSACWRLCGCREPRRVCSAWSATGAALLAPLIVLAIEALALLGGELLKTLIILPDAFALVRRHLAPPLT